MFNLPHNKFYKQVHKQYVSSYNCIRLFNASIYPSPIPNNHNKSRRTLLVNYSYGNITQPFNSTSVPIYQTATFEQDSCTTPSQYDYTRSGNPTRTALELQLASIEQCKYSSVFVSGMSAINTLIHLLDKNSNILASDDIYGGTYRLLSSAVPVHSSHQILYTDICD